MFLDAVLGVVGSKGIRKWRRVRQTEREKISLTRRCRGVQFFPSKVRSLSWKPWRQEIRLLSGNLAMIVLILS